MTVITYDIPVKPTRVVVCNAPICKCGGVFDFANLHSGKRKKYQGILATCQACKTEYYDMYEHDLLKKITRMQQQIKP